jgi:hypothetical protein
MLVIAARSERAAATTASLPRINSQEEDHDSRNQRYCPGFRSGDHRRQDPLPRLDRQQLDGAVLAPEGFHAGVHHRARLHKRTPADNQTVHNVFVIGPDKKVKLVLVYPMTTGRNFDEVLRVIDSLQLTAKHKVATPVNWQQGEDVIIAGSVSDEEAKKQYPQGWKAPKPYLRIVPQPKV